MCGPFPENALNRKHAEPARDREHLMSEANVLVSIGDDHVAEVILNRPNSLNTFTIPLARELNQAFLDLDVNPEVRVIVLKGAGKVFCAGIDVGYVGGKSGLEYREWIDTMMQPLLTITRIRKPVIAQVRGTASANGAGLVAVSDLAIAGERARIGLTAINVGLSCIGPSVPVSRSIGRKKTLEMLYFGELVPAPEALAMGLINRVVPGDALEDETRAWALKLAQKSPTALQLTKRAFYTAADMEYEKAMDYMKEAFVRLCATEDAQEGIAAFTGKRQPVWQGK